MTGDWGTVNGASASHAPSNHPSPITNHPNTVPLDAPFSGFIFKIQANMDPRHRDRIGFLRICSGKFTRDMFVTHQRTGKRVRLSSAHKVFAQERETVDEAYAGDVIGIVGHNEFGIGDTLTEDPAIRFDEIPASRPSASPTCKIRIRGSLNSSAKAWISSSRKASCKSSNCATPCKKSRSSPPLARCNSRSCNTASKPNTARRAGSKMRAGHVSNGSPGTETAGLKFPTGCRLAYDSAGQPGVLFPSAWTQKYFTEQNGGLRCSTFPRHRTPGENVAMRSPS